MKSPDASVPDSGAQATEGSNEPQYILVSRSWLEQLEKEKDQLKDRLLRALAEWDNARKRLDREREEITRYANQELFHSLLPVIDNLERAVEAAQQATSLQPVAEGLRMVWKQLQSVLEEAGLQPVEALGKPFDPFQHEALGEEIRLDHPEGTVISQLRKGYMLRGKLLRPAGVVVAKSPEEGEGSNVRKDAEG
ncbi:nucleotide exchange factor GrpE [Candidatus Methylacidithermus pantelleriae]|uniref:Protein GrpE n=1 Tax=Candidatus Methylacidithermus pantelleriae TaxID=2744239 RepID=A0A8J2BR76_9BACT|nr:nucleotide exchange factor GrpE [Candidatus Methylacidithermus pantelleriae]CAF0700805.1 Protein GrpE [Candidatus Methylacidithermus pantelleriae]